MPSSPSNSPPSSSQTNVALLNRVLPSRSRGEPKPKVRRVSQSAFLPTVSAALPFSLASGPRGMCVGDILNTAVAPKYDDNEECAESHPFSLAMGCLDESDCAEDSPQPLSSPALLAPFLRLLPSSASLPFLGSFPASPPLSTSIVLQRSAIASTSSASLIPSTFEMESVAAIAFASTRIGKLTTLELQASLIRVLKRSNMFYFVFEIPKKTLPFPYLLGTRLLSLKTGNAQPFTSTASVYKFINKIFVPIDESECSQGKNCLLNLLFFEYKKGKNLHNTCYQVSSNFSFEKHNVIEVFHDPLLTNAGHKSTGRIKNVSS